MKQYIVEQSFRCCYTKKGDGKTMNPYRFSEDVLKGTYSEENFKNLVGDEFFTSGFFKNYCDLGWIKVLEVKDVTTKLASKSLDILK